eukprot:6288196-Prymnesium_polylepis.1
MFTSGSTGKPKGVMVPHGGVVNILFGARSRYKENASCVFGVPTPYVFDVSVYNVFASLVVHCGICQLLADGSSLVAPAKRAHFTRAAAVPSILANAQLPPTLQEIEVGGEALTQTAVDSVSSGVTVLNYYGPTEAAIWATRRRVIRGSPGRLASIGRPLPNVTCYVVDPDGD